MDLVTHERLGVGQALAALVDEPVDFDPPELAAVDDPELPDLELPEPELFAPESPELLEEEPPEPPSPELDEAPASAAALPGATGPLRESVR